jgi:hypothetical protein
MPCGICMPGGICIPGGMPIIDGPPLPASGAPASFDLMNFAGSESAQSAAYCGIV